ACEGEWVWRWKNWIDRRWMRKYQELPLMASTSAPTVAAGLADAEGLKEISALAMRCGGCGAKVGSTILARVLQRLNPAQRDDVLVGLNSPDDAAGGAAPPPPGLGAAGGFFFFFLSRSVCFWGGAVAHFFVRLFR